MNGKWVMVNERRRCSLIIDHQPFPLIIDLFTMNHFIFVTINHCQ